MADYLAPEKIGGVGYLAPLAVPAASTGSTVTGVIVTPPSVYVVGGGTVDFDWVVLGTNNPSQSATVSTTLGTIDANGVLTAPPSITAVQKGTVTVTSVQDPTVSGTAVFSVSPTSTPGFSVKVRYIRIRAPLSSKTNFK